MKLRNTLLPLFAGGALVLPSLGDSGAQLIQAEAEAAPSSGAELTVVPDFDINAMAKKLGFAAHMPKNTEVYASMIGGYDMFQRLTQTEIGKFVVKMMADQGVELDQIENDENMGKIKNLLGEEIFLAYGDTTGEQMMRFNTMGKSSNFHQMKMMMEMAVMGISGEFDFQAMEQMSTDVYINTLADFKGDLPLIEKTSMPPVMLGFKVSDADQRAELTTTLNELLVSAMDLGFPVEALDEKKGDLQLKGISLLGKELAGMLDDDVRAQMSKALGSEESLERVIKALEAKNIHVATGVKGDYIFIFLGDSLDDLKFADQPEDSLLANSGLDFLKDYTDKDLRMFFFGEEEALKQMTEGREVFASMARGVKAGFADTDIFGDTRDIQALLEHIAKVEGSLFGMMTADRTGGVGFLEDGFKMETHGGTNLPMLNTDKSHTFSSLGEMEDVFYFSNSRTNPEFTARLFDMMDSIGQATYLMVSRVADLELGFIDFKSSFQMFDQVVASDLRGIWEAVTTDWVQGTGDEGALIIDTRGTLPKVKDVPGVILENGRMPRIAYVTPVADRAKITRAWTRIEKAIINGLNIVKEMGGPEIPMQEINDNTKEGVTYYSTAIPFSTKDARPVIGLNDDLFFASTSQKFIAELNATLSAKKDAPARKGSYTRVNFTALTNHVDDWVALLKENMDEIFESDFEKEDFKENLPMIENALQALREFDEMTAHTRKEDGKARTSIHFKMK